MCGRYSLVITPDFGKRFRVHIPAMGLRSRFNIAPGQAAPVICAAGERQCVAMRWGFVPAWAGEAAYQHPLINARSETAPVLPAFKDAFVSGRCIVPASGFYEWKEEGSRRVPFYYHRADGNPIGLAGLYTTCHPPGGPAVRCFALLTTPANDLVSAVHDRMPAILPRDREDDWLAAGTGNPDAMLAPAPPGMLVGYPVSSRVNSPDAEGEACIRPVATLF
ncbi:MAG: SOS response-associated peptidase [Methanomicrobiales archaeon]|nr:SOS response-associated peptidase [Methanomicrobiales archaeon]